MIGSVPDSHVFRDIAVFTAAPIRERSLTVDNTKFVLRKTSERLLFGLRAVWRKSVKVQVSDPTRTLVDILDDPRWGGGIRHVTQVLHAYLASEHRDEASLLQYIRRLGNAAAAKRLGYLLEAIFEREAGAPLLAELQGMVTPGYALLDPTVAPRGRFVAKWNLRANVAVGRHD